MTDERNGAVVKLEMAVREFAPPKGGGPIIGAPDSWCRSPLLDVGTKRGKITIEFATLEDLQRIADILGPTTT